MSASFGSRSRCLGWRSKQLGKNIYRHNPSSSLPLRLTLRPSALRFAAGRGVGKCSRHSDSETDKPSVLMDTKAFVLQAIASVSGPSFFPPEAALYLRCVLAFPRRVTHAPICTVEHRVDLSNSACIALLSPPPHTHNKKGLAFWDRLVFCLQPMAVLL